MSRSSGGASEAFDRADRLFVRFRTADEVRAEQEVAFAPAAQTVVRLDIPLRQVTEVFDAEIELRMADRPLFRGTAAPTLSAGITTPIDLTLDPVVAGVTCGSGTVQLWAYGQTAPLSGAALFATGDTVRDVPVTWSPSTSPAVSVSETGVVAALQDGDASATCGASGFTGTRSIRVFAVVTSIQVAPASATLVVGSSLAHTSTLLDARGNAITTPRPHIWSSTNGGIASVSPTGLVTGVSAGSVRIESISDGVVGSASVVVVSPSTAVTIAATNVTGTTATLVGSVNPNGVNTQAWFEWGTDANLATPTVTPAQPMGSGAADQTVTQAITNLLANTTYYFRVVASSAGAVVRGSTLNFTTPRPPSVTTSGLDPAVTTGYVVRGTATPNGTATTAWFEYSTSSTLSGSVPTTRQSVGSGPSPIAISQSLSGLQQFTTYYVRALAQNIGGTGAGAIVSFRTGGAPTLGTTRGVESTANCVPTAAVSSSASPNGLSTDGWFEYDTSSTFPKPATTPRQALGSGTSFVPFSSTITLSSRGTYFRAVASNSFGTVRSGAQQLFPPICVR